MARKKMFPTREEMKNKIQEWVDNHELEIIDNLLLETNYNSLDELRYAERNMKWGLDCGFVYYIPYDPKMCNQWKRERWDRISISVPFDCQSTTLKTTQYRYILNELGLSYMLFVYSVLD